MEFNWPQKFRGAVSLTFDDGLMSQLKNGIPLLEKFGFKGTFYIIPRDEEQLKTWKEVSERGHEVGNHSLKHPCSSNYPWYQDSKGGLEDMTLEDIRLDIVEAHNRIRKAIPNGSKTFAYPCFQTSVGRGLGKRSYVPIVAEMFVAARSGGAGYPNSPIACDLHELWSCSADSMSIEAMIGMVVKESFKGRWVIFTFHGVGGDYLQVSEDKLISLLEFLDENRERVWVAPVVEIAEYIASERRKQHI
ncbi:MAG: polysaccharide deacetylase family protein [Thermoproteota archaeon]